MPSVFKKKRFPVLFLTTGLFIFVAVAPYLISSTASLNLFLSAANKRIDGQLKIDSWVIGWQEGILCTNVSYSDETKGIRVTIPTLTSNRGLMQMLLVPTNLGTVQLDTPEVLLSGPSLQAYLAGKKDNKTVEQAGAKESKPVWDGVLVDVVMNNGKVRTTINNEQNTIDFQKVDIDASLETGIVTYDARFHSQMQGSIQVSGSLNLPFHTRGWLETIIAETQFNIESLQIKDFLSAVKLNSLPQGSGILNADFKIKATGYDDLQFNGLAELQDATFHGGLLNKDQPRLKKMHIAVEEGKWSMGGWRIMGLQITSDFLSIEASGNSSPDHDQIELQGNVNLPVVFDQLPNLLNVNESLFLETGDLSFSAKTNFLPQGWQIDLRTRVEGIGGISADERFTWSGPLWLLFKGTRNNDEIEVNNLSFEAPFMQLKGSGKLDSFVMDAVLDVQQTLSELRTLFQHELAGQGRLEMTARSTSVGEKEDHFSVDVNMNIADFTVNRRGQAMIPAHELSLVMGLNMPKSFVTEGYGELDCQVTLSSWLGEFFLVMQGSRPQQGIFKGYYTTDSELQLDHASAVMHALHVLPENIRMGGSVQFQAEGFGGQIPLEIRDLTAEFTDFTLEGNQAFLREPRALLRIHQPVNDEISFLALRDLLVVKNRDLFVRQGAGLNLIDMQNKSLVLHNVTLETDAGISKINTLGIPDWQKPFSGAWTQLDLKQDLAQITKGLQVLGLIPQVTTFSGLAELDVDWTREEGLLPEYRLDLRVADFGMRRKSKAVIESDSVRFTGAMQGNFPHGEIIVESLKLESGTLEMEATGKVTAGSGTNFLELRGSIRPDLQTFGKIIANEFDMALQMLGRPQEEFVLTYPLWKYPKKATQDLRIATTLHADQLMYNNIVLNGLVSPIRFENSVLHLDLFGQLHDGRLEVATDIDFGKEPPILTVPASSLVLKGVSLTEPIRDTFLSRIHPLFGGLARPTGQLDLQLDSFWWPLREKDKNQASFVVILGARGMQLEKKQPIRDILGLVGLEKETLTLMDNEIYCIGKNGQTKCSPVRILAGDSETIIGGSMQLDGSLDYNVELPFTRNIVSNKVYQVLDGTKVRVNLQGSSREPSFDRDGVLSKIESLRKQAEEEVARKGLEKGESS